MNTIIKELSVKNVIQITLTYLKDKARVRKRANICYLNSTGEKREEALNKIKDRIKALGIKKGKFISLKGGPARLTDYGDNIGYVITKDLYDNGNFELSHCDIEDVLV